MPAGACKYEAHDEPSEVEDVNKKWEEMKAKWASLSEHEKARCALSRPNVADPDKTHCPTKWN